MSREARQITGSLLPHQIRFWHGCQTRQVDPSTILVLVETARRGSCSRLRGIVGIFGAHELPGGVAKAVMNDVYTSCPSPLGFYLTEEMGYNLSMLVVIEQNQLSLEGFAESPTTRMRMAVEKAKSGGPSATTVTSREPTNDDLIVSQQYLCCEQRFSHYFSHRQVPASFDNFFQLARAFGVKWTDAYGSGEMVGLGAPISRTAV